VIKDNIATIFCIFNKGEYYKKQIYNETFKESIKSMREYNVKYERNDLEKQMFYLQEEPHINGCFLEGGK